MAPIPCPANRQIRRQRSHPSRKQRLHRNPGAAKDIAAALRDNGEEIKGLYERVMAERREDSQRSEDRLERLADKLIDAQRDMARGGQNPTVVVAGSGGASQVTGPQGEGVDGTFKVKSCPHCHAMVDAQLNICPECKKPMK